MSDRRQSSPAPADPGHKQIAQAATAQKQLIILSFPNTVPSVMEKLKAQLEKLEIKGYQFLIINKELHSISKEELLKILKEAPKC